VTRFSDVFDSTRLSSGKACPSPLKLVHSLRNRIFKSSSFIPLSSGGMKIKYWREWQTRNSTSNPECHSLEAFQDVCRGSERNQFKCTWQVFFVNPLMQPRVPKTPPPTVDHPLAWLDGHPHGRVFVDDKLCNQLCFVITSWQPHWPTWDLDGKLGTFFCTHWCGGGNSTLYRYPAWWQFFESKAKCGQCIWLHMFQRETIAEFVDKHFCVLPWESDVPKR